MELLNNVAKGDQAAFRQLFDCYRGKVYVIAFRILQSESEAEDVLQDVFTKLWLNREKLTGILHFNAYLNTLIRNHIFNGLRKKAYEEDFLWASLQESRNEEGYQVIELNELKELLHKAMNTLPPQQKKVFQLGRLEGLKHEEIAAELGISKETVKKHMAAALRYIKYFLNGWGKELPALTCLFFLF